MAKVKREKVSRPVRGGMGPWPKSNAMGEAHLAIDLSDLILAVPIERDDLRAKLKKLRDRLAVKAAKDVLAAWRKP